MSKMATMLQVGLLAVAVLCPYQVWGYYCDSDKCGEDEYCCGKNICCTSYDVWQMWYFWCGIVLFIILLSACAGFCRYRYYQTAVIIQGSNPYSRLDAATNSLYAPAQATVPYADYPGSAYPSSIPPKYTPNYPPPPYAAGNAPEKDPNHIK